MMKKFRRMSGIFILCIGLLLSSIPVGASDRENDLDKLETNLISQIAEEYGFAEEKASLVLVGGASQELYSDGGHSEKAILVSDMDEDGHVVLNYYVPYSYDENEELVNSFSYLAGYEIYSGNVENDCNLSNIVIHYIAKMDKFKPSVTIGYFEYTFPFSITASYRFTGDGKIPETFSLSVVFTITGSLYKTPECLQEEIPKPAFEKYTWNSAINVQNPVQNITYTGTSSIPFPSGYLIRVDNNMPHGAAIWFTVNYKDSKGNYKEIQDQIGL